jgi:hypothetical protein
MEQLRKGPVTVSGPSFTEALERYTRLRNLEFSRLNFSGLPAIQLRNLARYAGMASARYIARMPEARRLAVLTAFVKAQEIAALDEAVDVLDMLILTSPVRQRKGQKKRLRTLKDLDRAALLARACALLLDENTDESACERPYSKACRSQGLRSLLIKLMSWPARIIQIFRMKWWSSTAG